MGLTQMQVDHIAGFHDGYTAHLERPFARTGRRSFKLNPMATIWLEALGLRLVVAPAGMQGLCGERPGQINQRHISSRMEI